MTEGKVIIVSGFLLGVILVSVYFLFGVNSTAKYSGIVVPHHDMVRSLRLAFLDEVVKVNDPKTIVLISPDHFNTNRFTITASTRVWELSFRTIFPNLELIEELQLSKDSGDFLSEHGITTVLPDIGKAFPAAKVVPVMISDRATEEELKKFIDLLYLNCAECLLVASVDFSHSFQADVASLHDVATLRSLYQLDSQLLYDRAEVDSPGSLLSLSYWASKHNTEEFKVFSHTNSGLLNKTLVGEMTTHIIGGYKEGERVRDLDNNLTMMFGGDVMFARDVHDMYINEPSEALTNSLGDRTFWGVDVSVVNFEGVFAKDGKSVKDAWYEYPPIFRFEPIFIKSLKAARIDVVSLSNNHNDDGEVGEYEETKVVLNSNEIQALESATKFNEPITKVVGDTKIALFGYSLFEESEDLSPLIGEYAGNGYHVVVYVHFGNEYDIEPTEDQVVVSRRFIDAGASLVIGSHPHVLQFVDLYKGVPIVYSLGNLLFDQNQNGADIGAILGVNFDTHGLSLFLAPVNSFLASKYVDKDLSQLLEKWHDNELPGPGSSFYFPYN